MSVHEETLSGRDFSKLCDFVYSEAGIRLGPEKKTMLEGRLKRRLRELEHRLVQGILRVSVRRRGTAAGDHVLLSMWSRPTRQISSARPKHFDYLTQRALPELTSTGRRAAAAGVERWMLVRRGAVHPGDVAERIWGDASWLPVSGPGDRHFDEGPGEGGTGVFTAGTMSSRCPCRCGGNI